MPIPLQIPGCFHGFDCKLMTGLTPENCPNRSKCDQGRLSYQSCLSRGVTKLIKMAQEEARRLGHNFVGTEHILLGLIGERTGNAARALKSQGINLREARRTVEKIIDRGPGFSLGSPEIPFTISAERLLGLALQEAHKFGYEFVETEHLVSAFINQADLAHETLSNFGIDLQRWRDQVVYMSGKRKKDGIAKKVYLWLAEQLIIALLGCWG